MAATSKKKPTKSHEKIKKKLAQPPYQIPHFLSYDPYMTFHSDAGGFVRLDGTLLEMDDDHEALFRLGKNIFKELCGDEVSREEFIQGVNNYKEDIKEYSLVFKRIEAEGNLKILNPQEFIDWESLDDTQILGILWERITANPEHFDDAANNGVYKNLFLIRSLISIDDVLISKGMNVPVVSQIIDAVESFSNALAIGSRNENLIKIRSKNASDNAKLRLKNNPEAKAIEDAKQAIQIEWYKIPQSKKKFGLKADFSRNMQKKYSFIKDDRTIRDWVTDWEKLPTS